MGQEEIIAFLENNKNKPFTPQEIADAIDVSVGSVHSGLRALRRTDMLKCFQVESRGRDRFAYYIGEVSDEEKDSKVLNDIAGFTFS